MHSARFTASPNRRNLQRSIAAARFGALTARRFRYGFFAVVVPAVPA